MTKETKIALIGIPLGFALFYLLQRYVFSKTDKMAPKSKPAVSERDMETAGSAYAEAIADNAPQSVLNELNTTFADEYNCQVHQNASDGSIVITDMAGNQLAIYQQSQTAAA